MRCLPIRTLEPPTCQAHATRRRHGGGNDALSRIVQELLSAILDKHAEIIPTLMARRAPTRGVLAAAAAWHLNAAWHGRRPHQVRPRQSLPGMPAHALHPLCTRVAARQPGPWLWLRRPRRPARRAVGHLHPIEAAVPVAAVGEDLDVAPTDVLLVERPARQPPSARAGDGHNPRRRRRSLSPLSLSFRPCVFVGVTADDVAFVVVVVAVAAVCVIVVVATVVVATIPSSMSSSLSSPSTWKRAYLRAHRSIVVAALALVPRSSSKLAIAPFINVVIVIASTAAVIILTAVGGVVVSALAFEQSQRRSGRQ